MTEEDRISGDLPFKCWRCLPLADRKKLNKFTEFLLEKERKETAAELKEVIKRVKKMGGK